jgi:uncharacterized SAM-binding protein YcdF (DUF218 family)
MILLLGLILLWFTRKQKAGKIVVTLGMGFLFVFSCSFGSESLLRPLEHKYPPLITSEGLSSVSWVVVLGGGHTLDPRLPVTSQISNVGLSRLVEGIRIFRGFHGSKLILSGGSVFEKVSNAEIMAGVAKAIGIKEEDILLETTSRDTAEEARAIKQWVGDDQFIMVTSASHMPRAMALFRNLGMKPIPAPTDFLLKEIGATHAVYLFPNASELCKTERAFYEYMGLIWTRLQLMITAKETE